MSSATRQRREESSWGAAAALPVTAVGVVRARRCLGLTQAELASVLGVGRVTVARWETGVMSPARRSVAGLLALLEDLATRADMPHAPAARRGEIAQRFALVALFGGRVRLTPRAWSDLLDVAPDALSQVSTSPGRDGAELASGADVGAALEERLRGRKLDADGAAGERRLAQEVLSTAERWRRT
jgi:transcriptional regulator with XRE-family HTH domain